MRGERSPAGAYSQTSGVVNSSTSDEALAMQASYTQTRAYVVTLLVLSQHLVIKKVLEHDFFGSIVVRV